MANHHILFVEDCEEDVEVLRRIFARLKIRHSLHHCADALCALDFLRGQGRFRQAPPPRPSLILLDLNLPGMDGRALLQHIRADAALGDIPVIVMSSSAGAQDLEFCYRHGANAYQVKPMDLAEMQRIVHVMIDYWFGAVVLPPSTTGSAVA